MDRTVLRRHPSAGYICPVRANRIRALQVPTNPWIKRHGRSMNTPRLTGFFLLRPKWGEMVELDMYLVYQIVTIAYSFIGVVGLLYVVKTKKK